MDKYRKLENIIEYFWSLYTSYSIVLIALLIRDFINSLIFPSVPRTGILFVVLTWINTIYGVFFIGFLGFIVLLSLKLFRDYLLSPPYEVFPIKRAYNLDKKHIGKVYQRTVYPLILALIGAIIPPIFGGWGLFYGGSFISVNKSDIPVVPSESANLISKFPIIGEFSLVDRFLMVPNSQAKILFVVLSGLVLISLWNLFYLSLIYRFSDGSYEHIDSRLYLTIKWLPLVGVVAALLIHSALHVEVAA
jgi:hypothetical protein